MSGVKTTAAQILRFSIKGINLLPYIRRINVRESICTSYLSGEATLIDHNNVINSLQAQGGDPIQISFDAPINPTPYEMTGHILAIEGQPSTENLKHIVYSITFVGSEYFTDRGNLVQDSPPPGTTGSSAAQKIWKDMGFESLLAVIPDTPITDQNAFTIQNLKPFTAIKQIRDHMYHPQFPNGNVLLFRDSLVMNLKPLESLFRTPSQEYFIQKATWGTSWRDIFESERAIIYAAQKSRQETGGGRIASQGTAASASQTKKVFDNVTGGLVSNLPFAQAVQGLASGSGGLAMLAQGALSGSGLGGVPNLLRSNQDRASQATDFTNKVERERAYADACKGSPQYTIKVPLQLGINCTVGRMATFFLIPPAGDTDVSGLDPHSGPMLITDLMHEVWNSQSKMVLGSTTFQALKEPQQ